MILMREFNNEEDFMLMQELIRENYLNNDIQLYPAPSDLEYWRYIYDETPEGVHSTMLWQDDKGHTLAFAWMNEEAVDYVCHYKYKELLKEIIEWSEKERIEAEADNTANCLYIFDCDPEAERIAEEKGYSKSDIYNYYGRRSLLEQIPKTQLPEGYIIKSIDTDEEISKRAAMNVLAGNEISFEKYKYCMEHAVNYRQELDLIALSKDGELAGYCTVWYDSTCRIGVFEPYAVHPDHLRKGLGRCLLSEGMSRLASLGCISVYVTHAGLEADETDPALALNEAVWFKRVGKNYLWYKKLAAE